MLFHLSSVSLSRPTRPKFIVLFPCIARAESVIATILYIVIPYILYSSRLLLCCLLLLLYLYLFGMEEHLRILFTDTGMPRSKFTARI